MNNFKFNLRSKTLTLIGSFLILTCCSNEPILEEGTPEIPSNFPDSTNLTSKLDSFIFAQDCFLEQNRGDIAERYFKSLIKNWNRSDSCNVVISDSFSWLSSIEMKKAPIDTTLVLMYCDSANIACPKIGQSYFSHAATLIELELDSSEYFLNLAVLKGQEIVIVSEFIQVNLDKIDTTKLNFDWLSKSEIEKAYK